MISAANRSSRCRKNNSQVGRKFRPFELCNKNPNEKHRGNTVVQPEPTTSSSPVAFLPSSIASSVGPASLVGGTAAIYTSLLQHPKTDGSIGGRSY
ncbi:unnamed protein product [Pseudo-nitzschia multistriata]|uniref:Uncharacterized protein n=1 Tax=Pseudo-nitzschia multistriata TaxID=183589 RepID=A0A448Z8X6_9STRA|nr:unnamed protein product [Pseudo-nitzschia multistriata]